MKNSGFYNIKTPSDLLDKAKRDYEKLKTEHSSIDLAFNFFVTIEHMPDWLRMNRQEIKSIKDNSHVLRVRSHLACGIKHFEPFDSYKSVKSTQENSVYEEGIYESGIYDEWLTVNLDGDEITEFGRTNLTAIKLGEMVIEYWVNYLNENDQA
jgi:hypothetical protein